MSDWLYDFFQEMAEEFSKEKPKGYFPVDSISKIPYIEYQDFSEEENTEVWKQAVNVMRTSWHNKFAEVSVTYRMDDNAKDKKYTQIIEH